MPGEDRTDVRLGELLGYVHFDRPRFGFAGPFAKSFSTLASRFRPSSESSPAADVILFTRPNSRARSSASLGSSLGRASIARLRSRRRTRDWSRRASLSSAIDRRPDLG